LDRIFPIKQPREGVEFRIFYAVLTDLYFDRIELVTKQLQTDISNSDNWRYLHLSPICLIRELVTFKPRF
jgi:hypothetical protein